MEQRRQQQMPHPEEPRGGGDLHGGRRTAPPVLAEDEGAEGGGGARAHRSLLAKAAELGVDGIGAWRRRLKNGRRGRSRRGEHRVGVLALARWRSLLRRRPPEEPRRPRRLLLPRLRTPRRSRAAPAATCSCDSRRRRRRKEEEQKQEDGCCRFVDLLPRFWRTIFGKTLPRAVRGHERAGRRPPQLSKAAVSSPRVGSRQGGIALPCVGARSSAGARTLAPRKPKSDVSSWSTGHRSTVLHCEGPN
ncbi:hypothetical protein OsI_12735 [Oryza sativa Indica Group]|uniref:Uncharacterized protein n=1 Tax=Oryza sativa subsp. indica TaxID=39946 RepID=B8AN28_ORYSI|nr:hypothetical protein OsI_12735 [Oryza sativa Indica Group]